MRNLILSFIAIFTFHPATHAVTPFVATVNECKSFLGFSEETYQVDFNHVLVAAASLRSLIARGDIDPNKYHIEGFSPLAGGFIAAIDKTIEKFVLDESVADLLEIRNEISARLRNGNLTYNFMMLLPVRLNLVFSPAPRAKYTGRISHSAYLRNLEMETFTNDGDRDVLKALRSFPSQLHLPVMQKAFTEAHRGRLLNLGVWAIEVVRTPVRIGGLKTSPYTLATQQFSHANHFARYGVPKFWLNALPWILDAVRRAEVDQQLVLGTLQPLHDELFSKDAGYIFELQQNCPTVECLIARLKGAKEIDSVSSQLEPILGQKSRTENNPATLRLAKLYLKAFKTGLQQYVQYLN